MSVLLLKKQYHKIFYPFLFKKKSIWAPYEQFRSQQLRGLGGNVVVDVAHTFSA